MKCKNCGYEFEKGNFCPECGTKQIDDISTVPENTVNVDNKYGNAINDITPDIITETAINEEKRNDINKKNVKADKQATIALILGILSLLSFITILPPFVLGIISIVLAVKALKGKTSRKGRAITGLVLSIITLLLLVLLIIFVPDSSNKTQTNQKEVETVQDSNDEKKIDDNVATEDTETLENTELSNEAETVSNNIEKSIYDIDYYSDNLISLTMDTLASSMQKEGIDIDVSNEENYSSVDGGIIIYDTELGLGFILEPINEHRYGVFGIYTDMTVEEAKDVLLSNGAVVSEDGDYCYVYNNLYYISIIDYNDGIEITVNPNFDYIDTHYEETFNTEGTSIEENIVENNNQYTGITLDKDSYDYSNGLDFSKGSITVGDVTIYKVENIPFYYDKSSKYAQMYSEALMNKNSWISLSVSSKEYKQTLDKGTYFYYGDLKGGRPNGKGVVIKHTDGGNDIPCYIGEFEDGRYDGFGIEFQDDVEPFATLLYEGYFAKSSYTGDGVIYCNTFNYYCTNDNYNFIKMCARENDSETGAVVSTIEEIGEFKGGALNGKGKWYTSGLEGDYYLYEEGTFEYGSLVEGKEYFENGQLKYEGEFKNQLYNGKGKLYDENGNLVYSGKFKDGDIK